MTVIYDESGSAVGDVMTDRRASAIDKAIDELMAACMESADATDDDTYAVTRILAEERLRGLIWERDATEPTDAEVKAALVAYERPMRADGAVDKRWPAMRAALIAARKARP